LTNFHTPLFQNSDLLPSCLYFCAFNQCNSHVKHVTVLWPLCIRMEAN
jgi:hypothetical protein